MTGAPEEITVNPRLLAAGAEEFEQFGIDSDKLAAEVDNLWANRAWMGNDAYAEQIGKVWDSLRTSAQALAYLGAAGRNISEGAIDTASAFAGVDAFNAEMAGGMAKAPSAAPVESGLADEEA